MRLARLVPLAAAIAAAPCLFAQSPQATPEAQAPQTAPATNTPPASPSPNAAPSPQTPEVPSPESSSIAIVPLDSSIPGFAAEVTGALQVNNGRAYIAADAAITAGSQTTHVTLPYRGTMFICAFTIVKLASDSSVPAGQTAGLLMAMDHGAVEMSFATTRSSDILLTPDFRILISGPGAAELKVRLGPQGDTCVDNAGANAPYVLVSSIFEGGAYRVQPGQRVMFQHGSLHEVVDQEKESCGCPPAEVKGNEFPLAQSEGLAPLPKSAPAVEPPGDVSTSPVAPLVYKSEEHTPQPAEVPASTPTTNTTANPATSQASKKKPGFFTRVGHFFRRIFGAD